MRELASENSGTGLSERRARRIWRGQQQWEVEADCGASAMAASRPTVGFHESEHDQCGGIKRNVKHCGVLAGCVPHVSVMSSMAMRESDPLIDE